MSELERAATGRLLVRAAGDGTDDRVIEGIVLPYGEVATVADPSVNRGKPYRETIARGAAGMVDPTKVTLEAGAHGGPLVGRGVLAEDREDGLYMALRVSRVAAGDELLELARDGVFRDFSIVFRPVAERTRPDGVVERTKIDIRRVAVLEAGAYHGANVTAVRAEMEEEMNEPTIQPAAPAEPEASRSEAVAADVQALVRSTITITRPDLVYGPTSARSFLADLVASHQGDTEAAAAMNRHYAQLDDMVRPFLGRAGDLVSSEYAGGIPNTYLPGLLTPRIAKGRPMGAFYENVAIADATPRIFAKVTTSGTVAAQSAEGAALSATDVATTAVSTTPTAYGAYIDLSRQVIDGGNPSAVAMVMDDLLESYAQVSEGAIKAAVEAGSTASGTAITAATPFAGTQGQVIAHYTTRFKAAEGMFVPSALFAVLLAEADTAGRPKMPNVSPSNANGVAADGAIQGNILGAGVYMSYQSTANVVVTGRRSDFVVFESPVLRFTYDQVAGPHAIRIGCWAYLGIGARLGSLKVTAA